MPPPLRLAGAAALVVGNTKQAMVSFNRLKIAFRPARIRWLMHRGSEPLHLNLLSIPVALFGSYRTKVLFDLVPRIHHAFSILFAADIAKQYNIKTITLIEFGVAAGAGLMNICRIAGRTTKATGVKFRVVGFDTGEGMPLALDYRDNPDL
jgi:hypothetical protein